MPTPKKTPKSSAELLIDAKRRELEDLRSRLVNRSKELDDQAIDLVARRTQLDNQAEKLSDLQERVEAGQRALAKKRQRLTEELELERERATRELAAERKRLTAEAATEWRRLKQRDAAHQQHVENDRQTLTSRLHQVEQKEHDLEHRIAKARDEIVLQRAEVKELLAGAQRRAEEVEAGREALKAEQLKCDQQLSELLNKAGELDRRDAGLDQRDQAQGRRDEQLESERKGLLGQAKALDDSRDKLNAELKTLEGHRQRIVKGRESLKTRTAQLDEQLEAERRKIAAEFDGERAQVELERRKIAAEFEAERTQLKQANAKFDSREKKLVVDREALAKREQALKSTAGALDARRADLAAADARLQAADGRLDQRRASIDALAARMEEDERSLDLRRSELDRLTEQIEERDAQSRQNELALEVEEQEIARHRTALENAEQRLDDLRTKRREELETTHAVLRERVEKIERAERSVLLTPPLWWLRASVSALAVGLCAGWLWLSWETPVYRGRADLEMQTTSPDVRLALSEHAALLLSPEFTKRWMDDAALRGVWQQSVRAGRVAAGISTAPARISLTLSGGRRETVERVVASAAARYREYVNGVAAQPRIPAAYADIPARKAQVAAALDETRAQRREAQTLLAVLPPASRREALLTRVRELRGHHVETVQLLAEARQRRLLLERDAGGPHGTVDPNEYQQALSHDESYQADREEFASEAARYRDELAVGMVPITQQFPLLFAALDAFSQAMSGQREQQPAPAVSGALEACVDLVEQFERSAHEVERRWKTWRSGLDKMPIGDEVVTLVRQQALADETAQRLARDCAGMLKAIDAQLDSIKGAPGGNTRQMVIVSGLRSDQNRMEQAHKQFLKAAEAVGRASNFRLDAHDMRLRGLKTRLSRRRELVRGTLQQRADRRTLAQRDSELALTKRQVEEYETLRGELALELIDRMDALRELDDDMLERRQLEAAISRHDAEMARLEQQERYLAGQLEQARRSGPKPDRVTALVDFDSELTAGAQRWQHAGVAGSAVFATVWMFCVLMILRNPFRRSRSLAATLAIRESPVGELTAKAP